MRKSAKVLLPALLVVPMSLVHPTAQASAPALEVAPTANQVTVTGKPDGLCTDPPSDWYVVASLSTNSLMLTNTTKYNGVACAYTAGSGRKSIKPYQTSNWSSSSPQGVNAEYKCYGDDGKNITYANSYVGSSGTGYTYNVQPTNWNTKTKHWGGAVLWSVADHLGTSIQSSQYTRTCNGDDGVINIARVYPVSMTMTGYDAGTIGVPSSYTIAVDAKYGGNSPVAGQVALMVSRDQTVGNADDTVLAGGLLVNGSLAVTTAFVTGSQQSPVPLAPGTYYLYGAYAGTQSATPAIPSSGWFKMATDLMTVTVSAPGAPTGSVSSRTAAPTPPRQSQALPKPFTGPLGSTLVEASTGNSGGASIICPKGGVPTQININSSDANIGLDAITLKKVGDRTRIHVTAPTSSTTQVQAICRKTTAPVQKIGNVTYGSAKADDITRSIPGSSVFTGPGKDTVVLSGASSVGEGGTGADDITVSARDGVGNGGFGNDTLRSTTSKRSMLIGGPGLDELYGGPGRTIINAQDGRPGDRIYCGSSQNIVIKDKGDIVTGPCKRG